MSRVDVVREHGDLEREVWTFSLFDFPKVYLEGWSRQTRKTKRHKFRAEGPTYSRLEHRRQGTINEEPEIPEDVLEEGLEKLRALVEFKVWRNR